MTRPSTLAPGWYPDPSGQPGQRYHDGRSWTTHFVPPPPVAPAPAQAVAVAVSAGGGTSHALHLVLTLLTCGLWLPIWILAAIFGGGGSSAVAVGGNGALVSTTNRRPLAVGAVFVGLFVLGTVSKHPWLIGVFIVIGLLAGLVSWAVKAAQLREEQLRHEQFQRDMLADRADYEDQLYQQGDPRGMHGRYMPPPDPL
ncbi:DUF2510 domain-containing protein [Mycolicibacterium mucogenicum]|uniref:DUF2510 domain-containing protein n=1 Tax=Mycolicibacterium mucogenicum TaxID=56689 RepID=UPI002269E685|nr:DUF2510 domain-containing protein [Mycolicibacterium mucogenicum]MCX8564011.1 DUF2510 domain-containing protein [Mycolicibacterium mucogenicum]